MYYRKSFFQKIRDALVALEWVSYPSFMISNIDKYFDIDKQDKESYFVEYDGAFYQLPLGVAPNTVESWTGHIRKHGLSNPSHVKSFSGKAVVYLPKSAD